MAVSSDTLKYTWVPGVGGTTYEIPETYSVDLDSSGNAQNFKLWVLNSDGVESELPEEDYSVSGLVITTSDVLYDLDITSLTINRDESFTQENEYPTNSAISNPVLEGSLDKLTRISLQLKERMDRAIVQPTSDAVAALTFPTTEERRNSFLAFDDDGDVYAYEGAAPEDWSTYFVFGVDDICQYDGALWRSKAALNQGNTPTGGTGDSFWEKLNVFGTAWDSGVVYAVGSIVAHNGLLYKALAENSGSEPPAVGAASTDWEELQLGGSGGLPNYIDDRAANYTADAGVALSTETSAPIDKDGNVKAVFTSVASGDGFYQDVEISEVDESGLLQLGNNLKNVTGMDFSELDIEVIDIDGTETLFSGNVLDYAEYNPGNGVYRFSAFVRTNNNNNLRVYFKANTTCSGTFQVSDVSLGAPFYLTVDSDSWPVGTTVPYQGVDLPTTNWAYASGPALSKTAYPELYAVVGDKWNDERVANGWTDLSVAGTHFYPGPSDQSYFRNSMPPLDFDNTDITSNEIVISAYASRLIELRSGTPFIFNLVSGTAPGGLSDGTMYYAFTDASGNISLATTEANAIAGTNAITSSGSGTFQLIQVGGYLEDAFQGHWHKNLLDNGSAGTKSLSPFNTNSGETSTNSSITDIVTDTVNGTPRTSNETRPTTAYMTYIVLAKPIRSVEFLKTQTNRDDAGEVIYSYLAPDANGKGKYDSLVFDSSYIHYWAKYPELLAIGATDLAMYIEDIDGTTFKMRDLSYDTGWLDYDNNFENINLLVSHNLGVGLPELEVKVSYRTSTGTVYDLLQSQDSSISGDYGFTVVAGSGDTDEVSFLTGFNGFFIMFSSGAVSVINNSDAGDIRIQLYRKDAPQEGTYAYLKTKSTASIVMAQISKGAGYDSPLELAVQDISTADKTTDLSIYESGGSLQQKAGFMVHVTWKDGDTTYAHKFTSGGLFYNQFMPDGLAPGDNSSTFAWCGYGTGGLTLKLKENLVDWDVLTDGCFDEGTSGAGYGDFYQFVNQRLELEREVFEASVAITGAFGSIFITSRASYDFPLTVKTGTAKQSNDSYTAGVGFVGCEWQSGPSDTAWGEFYLWRGTSTTIADVTHNLRCVAKWRD